MDLASMLNPTSGAEVKTPQRSVSLAQPPYHHQQPTPSPASLNRTSSLPAHAIQYRENSVSVSPKTMPSAPPSMPPPAALPIYATPSPVLSRKRSLSISDHQHTPQPAVKRRRHAEPPVWARREKDGHSHTPSVRAKREVKQQVKVEQIPPQHPVEQPHPHPGPSPMLQNAPRPTLEASIDNYAPYNDMIRTVGNWLWDHVVASPDYGPDTHIEVEAKLGTLLDPSSQDQRWHIPARSMFVISDMHGRGPRFESLMGLEQHKRLNEYLNKEVKNSTAPGRQRVAYEHTREVDKFFELPPQFMQSIHPAVREAQTNQRRGPRVRMTTDQKTNAVKATIIKTRMENLEIYCPNDEFDVRISISLETRYPYSIEGMPEHMEKGISTARQKDRLSYRHQGFQVDLTQVTPKTGGVKIHELEIELDAARLIAEGKKVQNGEDNLYEKLVETFLNNVVVINRAARPVQ